MKKPKLKPLVMWSFIYFDEELIDALENTVRHHIRRRDAKDCAGEWEFQMVKIISYPVGHRTEE